MNMKQDPPTGGACLFPDRHDTEVRIMGYKNSSITSSRAIGNVERELIAMRREARYIAARYHRGQIEPEEMEAIRRRFTGIFRGILEDALSGVAEAS